MIKAIREAGRTPVQRNTFYEPIKVLADSRYATARHVSGFRLLDFNAKALRREDAKERSLRGA